MPDAHAPDRSFFAQQLLEAMPDAVLVASASGVIAEANVQATRMFGLTRDELVGGPVTQLFAQDATASPQADMLARRRDGTTFPVELRVAPIDLDDGAGSVISARDLTTRREAETRLRTSDQRFRLAFEESPIGLALVGLRPPAAGRMLRVNRALCEMTGYEEHDLVGATIGFLSHPDDRGASLAALEQMMAGRLAHWQTEKRYVRADGTELWVRLTVSVARDEDGHPNYTIVQAQDITESKRTELELAHRALHDPLTGLANRSLLVEHLDRALAAARRAGRHVGVLLLDLDDFKQVNDALGHEAGDEYLIEVARRLRECLRGADSAARLGGDEFVLVCEDLRHPEDATAVARRLERVLSRHFILRGRELRMGASIGIITSGAESTTMSLLRDADAAMYRAKAAGKRRFAIADEELQAQTRRAVAIEQDLRRALESQQLRLDYQPCFDLTAGRMTGVEALVRWDHPSGLELLPAAFLQIAEERDLVAPLGGWVLREACRQAAAWRRRHGDDVPRVWVNVSCRQLGRADLVPHVRAALQDAALPSGTLGVELTERHAITITPEVRGDLEALRDLGVELAIDDFGTGHAGLEYLRELPVQALKIDGSFVAGLGRDRTDTALTSSMIALAHGLGLTCIAEGIEREEQRLRLRALGCDEGQGFLLRRPAGPAAIDELLATSRAG